MYLRPLRSRPQDSESAQVGASGGGVRRARKSNLLNDEDNYLNEARALAVPTTDAMR